MPGDYTCADCPDRTFASQGAVTMHRRWKHGADESPAAGADAGTALGSDAGGGAYADASTERRPSSPDGATPMLEEERQPTLSSRLFGNKKSPGGAMGGDRSGGTGERRPVATKKRANATEFWGGAVEFGASMVGRAGYVPMARSMVWSSPVAGEIIEDATKGTVVDRLVQPLVRNGEKWQDLFDLIGLWGSVGIAQANPAQAPAAMAFARKRLVNLLPRIAANIRKQRATEKAAVEALAELMPDLAELFPDAPEGTDPVDLLLRSLFAPPGMTEPQPEPVHADAP